MYFRNALCVILVFDLSNMESFNHLTNWISIANNSCGKDIPFVLLGNKSDLEQYVPDIQINTFAKDHNYPYFAVSSKSGDSLFIKHCSSFLLTNKDINKAFAKIAELASGQKKETDKVENEAKL